MKYFIEVCRRDDIMSPILNFRFIRAWVMEYINRFFKSTFFYVFSDKRRLG